jgi:hypothetical protein
MFLVHADAHGSWNSPTVSTCSFWALCNAGLASGIKARISDGTDVERVPAST